jgi:LacI family transcriptional regulator
VFINTIVAVSKHAGVSVATVSRVLNNSDAVKPITREKVLNSMRALGFRPNGAAQALGGGRSYGVGVMVGDLGSPYFGQMLKSIEEVIRGAGLHLLVSNGGYSAELEFEAHEFLQQRRSEALIVHVERTTDEELQAWANDRVPLVVVGRDVPDLAGQCVYLDNEQGGFLATNYLIGRGHRHIAHITGPLIPPAHVDSRARLTGYKQALEQHGLPFLEEYMIESDFTEDGGYRSVVKLLGRKLPMTAIFIGNDQMAAGAMQALQDSNLRVPNDISVVGYDNLVFSRYLNPQLTTIRQPLKEMGRAAAVLVLRALNLSSEIVSTRFQPELIVRQSVRDV